jgi:hypothetical protein
MDKWLLGVAVAVTTQFGVWILSLALTGYLAKGSPQSGYVGAIKFRERLY